MNLSTPTLLALLGISLTGCSPGTAGSAPAAPRYTTLDSTASQLRADFDQHRDAVRLLLLVDPVCAVCLRGLADINDALLKDVKDPKLQVFVVHEPVIGGTADDIAPAAGLLDNPHVHHYWDPTGNLGRVVTRSLKLENEGSPVYAWDVWMIYGQGARLGQRPDVPAPALFMHQLPELEGQAGRPFLDKHTFAATARELLNVGPLSQEQRL